MENPESWGSDGIDVTFWRKYSDRAPLGLSSYIQLHPARHPATMITTSSYYDYYVFSSYFWDKSWDIPQPQPVSAIPRPRPRRLSSGGLALLEINEVSDSQGAGSG